MLEDLDPTFLMEDSDLMLEAQDPMQEHSMKAQGKMEEDKLEITMEDSDLMQQDHRVTLLDHSMLGDHQETPMEDGLTEEQDREMVTMEADRHPMLSEQADLSAVVLVLVLV